MTRVVDWDVKNQTNQPKQKKMSAFVVCSCFSSFLTNSVDSDQGTFEIQ